MIKTSDIKPDDEEYKIFSKIFNYESNDSTERTYNKTENEVNAKQISLDKNIRNKESLEQKEEELRNILSLLTEYTMY